MRPAGNFSSSKGNAEWSALKELSDEELYRLMRKGNQLAFAQLYERRQPAIYRYALHMSGSRAAGEEIATKCLSG